MPDQVTIKELLIELGIDEKRANDALERFDDKTEKSASGAAQKFGSMAKKAGVAFAAIGAAATAAAGAIFKLVDEVTQAGDEIAKTARRAGIGVEELQRLRFAFDRSGASAEDLTKVAQNMNKNLLDAQLKGTGPLVEGMDELGLSISELLGLSLEQRLGKIADALNEVEDPARRSGLAARIIGEEAGPKLASLIAEGSDGIEALGDEAEALGLIMSEDAANGSEAFQDSMTNLKATVQGIVQTVAIDLIPMVKQTVESIHGWAKENRELIKTKLQDFVKQLVTLIKALAPAVSGLVTALNALIPILSGPGGLVALFGAMGLALGGLPGLALAAGAAIGVLLSDWQSQIDGTLASMQRLRREIASTRSEADVLEAGNKANRKLIEMSDAELAGMSDQQYERLVEDALRSSAQIGALDTTESFIADVDRRRAAAVQQQRDIAFIDEQGRKLSRLAGGTADERKQKAGGSKAATDKLTDLADLQSKEIGQIGLLSEVKSLGADFKATQLAIKKAANAAQSQIEGGASEEVARKAAVGVLSSLTGRKLEEVNAAAFFKQRLGKQITGSPLPELQASPTVVVTVNNFEATFNVSGAEGPDATARNIEGRMREFLFGELGKTAANLATQEVR